MTSAITERSRFSRNGHMDQSRAGLDCPAVDAARRGHDLPEDSAVARKLDVREVPAIGQIFLARQEVVVETVLGLLDEALVNRQGNLAS